MQYLPFVLFDWVVSHGLSISTISFVGHGLFNNPKTVLLEASLGDMETIEAKIVP